MKNSRTWLLLGAGAVLVASAEVAAQDRMQGSGIRVTKDRAEVSTTPTSDLTVISGGEVGIFDLTAYQNMSEKNIAAHMAAGDSLEIQISQLAQTKATDLRVRDFAAMLFNDHSAHLPLVIEIITDEDVGAEPMANDPEGMRMRNTLTRLRNMASGANWDAEFLRFQITHHQNEIDILNANIKNVHDDDFEDLVEKTLTSLAKHRDSGRSVATTLGVSLP